MKPRRTIMKDTQSKTRLKSDPRIRVDVTTQDTPSSIVHNILKYDPNSHTSKDEQRKEATLSVNKYSNIPHSPNSLLEYRSPLEGAQHEMETENDDNQLNKNTKTQTRTNHLFYHQNSVPIFRKCYKKCK